MVAAKRTARPGFMRHSNTTGGVIFIRRVTAAGKSADNTETARTT
jgi:hypothetical protein